MSIIQKSTEKTGVSVNNQEILRDEFGKFVKGTKCPNIKGRPKDTGFKQRLNELVGSDSRELALLLSEIAFYDQKANKDRYPRYKAQDRLRALELILKYKEQLPPQKIEAEVEMKSVNVMVKLPDGADEIDIN